MQHSAEYAVGLSLKRLLTAFCTMNAGGRWQNTTDVKTIPKFVGKRKAVAIDSEGCMTKKQMILNHLKAGNPITSLDAIRQFGVTRLSAVIFDLKKEGHLFHTQDVEVDDRFGNKCYVAQYKLIQPTPKGQLTFFPTQPKYAI